MKWVPANSSDCNTQDLDPLTYSVATIGANGSLTSSVPTPGVYVLCYRWNYASSSIHRGTSFVHLPHIRLLLVSINTASIFPLGTVVGCGTNVTILGEGFDLLDDLPISCNYGPGGSLASDPVVERNDSKLVCRTPSFSTSGRVGLYVMFGDVRLFPVLPSFGVVDLSLVTIESSLPAGGVYNTRLSVTLRGTGFLNLGGARCKFGDFMGEPATVFGNNLVKCPKPAFADSERSTVGSYPLSFSPNGQCFATPAILAANPKSVSSFTTYNAALLSLAMTGAPSHMRLQIGIEGSGLVSLPGSKCVFTRAGSNPTEQNATVYNSSYASCPSPRTYQPGTYNVGLLLNGVTETPTMSGDSVGLTFTEYDLSLVRVTSVFPPGVPVGETSSVTLYGSGFANYGAGQLICEAVLSNGVSARVSSSLLGTTGTSVLCPFSSPRFPDPAVSITVSLNHGAAGTFSADTALFTVYPRVRVDSIKPTKGDANGGNEVTIFGQGFTGLSTNKYTRQEFMRCMFGNEVQHIPPRWHNDTAIVCTTTWGLEDQAGQPVSVALNSLSFFSSGDRVRFIFQGLHKPALIEAVFSPDANFLIVRFDSQATNRAGMNGVAECSTIFDQATAEMLQGTSERPTMCEWFDDSVIVVLLDMYTSAQPGITIEVRENVLWPKSWTYPGSCDVPETMCAGAISISVSADFPCNFRDTPVVEACVTPVALIQAPAKISSCPGTAITLDGIRSTGGGIKPLKYLWGVHPTQSDNFYTIRPSVYIQRFSNRLTCPPTFACSNLYRL